MYLFISVLSLEIQRQGGGTWDPITGLTPPLIFATDQNQDPDIQHQVPFCVHWFEVRSGCTFVDIAGIVDNRCLNFLFLNNWNQKNKCCDMEQLDFKYTSFNFS